MVENRAFTGPGSTPLDMYPVQIALPRASKHRCKRIKPSKRLIPTEGNFPVEHPSQLIPHWPSIAQSTSSQESSPLAPSFCSSRSGQGNAYDSFQFSDAPSNFPGQRDFKFEDSTHHHNAFHVHNVAIPQPYFDTVPNTPVMSPSKFTPFPPGSVWPEGRHVTRALERYPEPLATGYMSAVTGPVTASQPPMLPSNMSYGPGSFTGHGDRRSTTPASDVQSAYESFPSIEYGEHQHHGLPGPYRRDYPISDDNGQPIPFGYPEATPDADFPAAALPGSVTRGFTGTSSGVSTFP
jgi:hypothetical protein